MYILVGWGEIEHCGGRWIYGLWCQVWAGWSKMIHIVLDGWRKKVLLSRRQSRLLLSLSSTTYVPLIKGFLLHDINSLTCGPSQSQKMSAIFSITADINDILASMYLTSRSFCSSKTSTNFCQRINPKLQLYTIWVYDVAEVTAVV